MKLYQKRLSESNYLEQLDIDFSPHVFLLFVSPQFEAVEEFVTHLSSEYPASIVFGCSTSGEIMGNKVTDNSISLTAISLDHTEVRLEEVSLTEVKEDSREAGKLLCKRLAEDDLKHILVLSDGLKVNGAELVAGFHEVVSENVSITGGLAGDGPDFKKTFIISNGKLVDGVIAGLAFYGDKLKVGFGSQGGWDSFGAERLVTKSDKNILYELDGEPALKLYKTYLGEKAQDLPGSGLLFPLSLRTDASTEPVVRTILAVDEENQSMTFAGNLPEGAYVRLMKANIDRLIDGAEGSAKISEEIIDTKSQLAILVSCVGRRLVLKQLVEEEVEVVNEILGDQVVTTGFYSYGEIAPFNKFSPCSLHNQTMTITTLAE